MFSLQSQHTDDSVTWDFMARRELEVGGAPELHSAQSRAADIMSREERCGAVYEEGLKNLDTGNNDEKEIFPAEMTDSQHLSAVARVSYTSGGLRNTHVLT